MGSNFHLTSRNWIENANCNMTDSNDPCTLGIWVSVGVLLFIILAMLYNRFLHHLDNRVNIYL